MIEIHNNKQILNFLNTNGISNLLLEPIKQDGSNRRYFRINNNSKTLLMDSNPTENNNDVFIQISQYLNKIGLSAPKIIQTDNNNGLFLIEDFGSLTFNEALKNNISEKLLYLSAVQCLSKIHTHELPVNIPIYDNKYLLKELKQ